VPPNVSNGESSDNGKKKSGWGSSNGGGRKVSWGGLKVEAGFLLTKRTITFGREGQSGRTEKKGAYEEAGEKMRT